MATIIGKLAVVVSANTAGIVSGLGAATKAVGAFATSVATVGGAAVVGGLTATGVGLTAIATHAFSAVDAVGDLAEKLGVGVEALSALQHAATMTDVDVEALNKGLGMFVKTMGKAGKTTDDLLGSFADVADQVANTNGIVEQGKIAFDNFGKGGLALLPLLRKGRSGIEELAQEARRLGVAFNAADVAKISEADNALKRVRASIHGIGAALAALAAPAVETIAQQFTSLVVAIRSIDYVDILNKLEEISSGLLGFANAGLAMAADFSNRFADTIAKGFNFVRDWTQTLGNGIIEYMAIAARGVVQVFTTAFGLIQGGFNALAEFISGLVGRILTNFRTALYPILKSSGMLGALDAAIAANAAVPKGVGAVDRQRLAARDTALGAINDVAETLKNALAGVMPGNRVGAQIPTVQLANGDLANFFNGLRNKILGPAIETALFGGAPNIKAAADAGELIKGGPSSQLGEALAKGSKEALSFVNRFRAGGDDKQEKALAGDLRREKVLERMEKQFGRVADNLDDEADI